MPAAGDPQVELLLQAQEAPTHGGPHEEDERAAGAPEAQPVQTGQESVNHMFKSMDGKARRVDNAIVEGFFGRLKSEFFHHRDWSGVTMPEFCRMLDTHLRYYNEERPKEKLGWMSPMQYRRSLGLAASRSKETSAPPIRRREGMRTGCPWRPGASASASCSARSRTSWGSGSRR